MKNLVTLLSGLLFGFGLLLSGMANPAKVQNFLDLFGTWDPSLAFVMGGAIAVTMPGFWLVTRRSKPFFNTVFHLRHWLGFGRILPRSSSHRPAAGRRRYTDLCRHDVDRNGSIQIRSQHARQPRLNFGYSSYLER
jgi:hypothetical protein